MKNNNLLSKATALILTLAVMLSLSVLAVTNEVQGSAEELVYSFVEAVNKKDMDGYISLFTNWNQEAMKSFAKYNTTVEFFKEDNIKLLNVKELTDSKGRATNISAEQENYDDVVLLYTEELITYKRTEAVTSELEDGYNYRVFVIVKEDGAWKIERVSVPSIFDIKNAGEGFGSDNEQEKMEAQLEKQSQLIEQDISAPAEIETKSLPTPPINTTIYFTKSANINNHGSTSASIEFYTYLENCVPNEWFVSYGVSYPSYLQVGVMASKMYAFRNTVYPKRNYSPYYACMLDNSYDQNYLYSAYSSLGSYYQSILDSAVSYNRYMAMVDYNENLFEAQYRTSEGTQYSGTLNQTAMYNQVVGGMSFFQCLHYYYSYSAYEMIKMVIHN